MADPLSGVGVSSIAGIVAAAKKSGLVPPLQDTNDYDPPPLGGAYHLTRNAVDWSNGGDAGTPAMDQFAAWVAANYGSVSLEIIHVNQDGSTVEWKNGTKQATGFYGQGTLAAHKNHVHWAITNNGLAAAGSPSVDATTVDALTPITASGTVDTSLGGKLSFIFQPIVNYAIDAGMVLAGVSCLMFGIILLFGTTSAGQKTASVAGQVVKARVGMSS